MSTGICHDAAGGPATAACRRAGAGPDGTVVAACARDTGAAGGPGGPNSASATTRAAHPAAVRPPARRYEKIGDGFTKDMVPSLRPSVHAEPGHRTIDGVEDGAHDGLARIVADGRAPAEDVFLGTEPG